MRLGLAGLVLVLGSACGDSAAFGEGATDDFIDMDTPPGQCSAGTTAEPCPGAGSSGAAEGEACMNTAGCAAGTACTAPFVGGELGEFTCSSQCIELGDESGWCLDASACCDAGAVCSARGLCLPDGALDESGSGTEAGSTEAATDSTESATSGTGTTSGGTTSAGSGSTSASGTAG